MRANEMYRTLLARLLDTPTESAPRGISTREIIHHVNASVDMDRPVITLLSRKLNYRFMCSEARWILLGQSDVPTVTEYCKNITQFSDDGRHMSGAYGPPFVAQLRYLVDCLNNDPVSRQAVATIWRPSPRPSRDIPCTVSLQFLIRNGHIHTMANMRSSDAWLGIPYDIFTFTMMTMFLALHLREKPRLGYLTITAGSQHLYRHDTARAMLVRDDNRGVNLDISLDDFDTPDQLLNTLWTIMDHPSDVILSPCTTFDEGLCKLILGQQ